MLSAKKIRNPDARRQSTRPKRRRQYVVSSLLVVYITFTGPSFKTLEFTEAFTSSSNPAKNRLVQLETALFATIENESMADTTSTESASSPQHYQLNGEDISNGHRVKNGHQQPKLSSAFPLEDDGGENDWSPESHMQQHRASLEGLHVEPFYAEKTTSTVVVTTPTTHNGKADGVVKITNGATNGKNGAHRTLPAAPNIVEANGEIDDTDSLSGFDTLSSFEPEDTSEWISDGAVANVTTTATKPPSRSQRAFAAARKVWGYVSPIQIFSSGYEDGADSLDDPKVGTVSLSATEEPKAEKQITIFDRRSRRKKRQLSNLLKRVNERNTKSMAGITSRTLTGLTSALAEEADGISVRMDAREDSPIWRKQIDKVSIEFTRLGFKPLYMGGPDQQLVSHSDDDNKKQKQEKNPFVVAKVQEEREINTPALPKQRRDDDDDDDDSCPVQYTIDADGIPVGTVSCADSAFSQIDVDNSGALDKDEIAEALVMATTASTSASPQTDNKMSIAAAGVGEGSRNVIKQLAKQLVDLYDTNDDGVIDRMEYQSMVEDMAALRQVQKGKEQKQQEEKNANTGNKFAGFLWNSIRGNKGDDDEGAVPLTIANATAGNELEAIAETALQEPETTGKIVLENVKVDLRQVLFGALPIVKHITPGGPLFLEPLKATVTASFTAEDIMKSTLLDAGLRQLVSFALRVRVRSLRDLADGAVFYGRKWKRDSVKAPLVQCTELISVEIDDKDRAIITGRAKVRASEDAPVIENSFKLRTKVATPRNGRAIKLSEPEIAIVIECPKQLEENINKTFARMNMKPPPKPKPRYTYIPIHSPFNKNDDIGGYYMGEDNRLKSMYIKDKCLRFEMEAILRPGKFLGSNYLAFTVPQRALIITVDRVKEGMRAARRRKKALKAIQKAKAKETDEKAHHAEDALALDDVELAAITSSAPGDEADNEAENDATKPGFISRFVDGYVQAGVAEDKKEMLAHAISDWFGRQGASDSKTDDSLTSAVKVRTEVQSENEISKVVETIALEQSVDDDLIEGK